MIAPNHVDQGRVSSDSLEEVTAELMTKRHARSAVRGHNPRLKPPLGDHGDPGLERLIGGLQLSAIAESGVPGGADS